LGQAPRRQRDDPYGYFASKAELVEAMLSRRCRAARDRAEDRAVRDQLRAECTRSTTCWRAIRASSSCSVGADEPRPSPRSAATTSRCAGRRNVAGERVDALRTLISFVVGHSVMARRRRRPRRVVARGLDTVMAAVYP